MVREISITVPAALANDEAALKERIGRAISESAPSITGYVILRRSLDARSRAKGVQAVLLVRVFLDEKPIPEAHYEPRLSNVSNAAPLLIVGAGPAGLFAALRAIELGFRPVIIERGKDVRARRRDLAAMTREGIVHPESNYCFGEGGAGTYSDGKLYTRSTKRGDVRRILGLFVHFGADPDILVDAHPHIGTNKLPAIITAMREAIAQCGGEIHFNTKLASILLRGGSVAGLTTVDGRRFDAQSIILATGHSARDVYALLHAQGIAVESKPFALGVRIEHPQGIIDAAQYHLQIARPGSGILRPDHLPPASYSLVTQAEGRGVFSFCMCPGGIIAPAATSPGEIVVNGWSPSKRNNPFANSGTVVTVDEADYAKAGFSGPLAGMRYQQMVEQAAFRAGGGALVAPAQRLADFVSGKASSSLPQSSYLPGLTSVSLSEVLPGEVAEALRQGLIHFGKKMKGYMTTAAVMVATESRTSSPVRIPRDKDTLQHPQIMGLFPCAEGAGYAGGIVSAAMDGERCVEAAVNHSPRP